MRMIARRLLSIAALLLAAIPPAQAQGQSPAAGMPIFDVHVHYSEAAWPAHPPADIVRRLNEAGVSRALVSSSPDDGTLTLHRLDPARFVPMLRPYRGPIGPGTWTEAEWTGAQGMAAYLEDRLRSGVYKGIGEFHLSETQAAGPMARNVAALAARHGLMVYVHSGAGPIRTLFGIEPGLRILWAHAGMSEPPEVVGALLDRHANLWTEVSFRAGDIGRGASVDPAWRAVFERHPDRFMIGTDTYTTSRWPAYGELVAQHRRWLSALPQELAEQIAWKNAERLFGPSAPPAPAKR